MSPTILLDIQSAKLQELGMPNYQWVEAPGEIVDQSSLSHTSHIWVRRCTVCRMPDLDSAAGQAALLEDTWLWRCPNCGNPDAIPVCLEFPAAHGANLLGCPYATRSGA